MTSRIVNRVPLLLEPSRRRHHYRTYNGPHKDKLLWALTVGYNPDVWQIPDDPFDATAWLTPTHEEAQQ